MEQNLEPRINGVEAVFMILVCLFFDAMDGIATLFDIFVGAGEFIKLFINAIASSILYFWITMKGVRPVWTFAGAGLEFIPFANALPIRTLTMTITIYMDWHPQHAEKIEATTRIVRIVRAVKKLK